MNPQRRGLRNPLPSSDAALMRMKASKPRNTGPEIAIRYELHKKGLRYRIDVRPLESLNRRADIVFRSIKLAIFIDGCFWHGCPLHGTLPKANAEFWELKIARNIERDRDTDFKLISAGWKVIRVWEHEDPKTAAENISIYIQNKKKILGD